MGRPSLSSQPWCQALRLLITPHTTPKLLHLVWLEAQAFLLMEVQLIWQEIPIPPHEQRMEVSWFLANSHIASCIMQAMSQCVSNETQTLPALLTVCVILQTVADDDFDDNFGLDEALNNATAGQTPTAPNSDAPGSMQQGFDGQQGNGAPPTPPGAQPPEILNCDCGLQCSYIMAKTAKNDGRWFYRCVKVPSRAVAVLHMLLLYTCLYEWVPGNHLPHVKLENALCLKAAACLQMSKAKRRGAMPLLPVGR